MAVIVAGGAFEMLEWQEFGKALGDDASNPGIIGTVRGVGYKLLLNPVQTP